MVQHALVQQIVADHYILVHMFAMVQEMGYNAAYQALHQTLQDMEQHVRAHQTFADSQHME